MTSRFESTIPAGRRVRLSGAFFCAGLLALGACQTPDAASRDAASTETAESAAQPAATDAPGGDGVANATAAGRQRASAAEASSEVASRAVSAGLSVGEQDPRGVLGAEEFAILRSPEFKKHFLDSFVASTDLTPQMTEDEREVIGEAMALFSDEKLDEAAKVIETNRTGQSSAVLDFYLGNIYYQQSAYDKAAAAYELAVQKHPNYERAHSVLAEVYYREQRYSDAIRAFAKKLQLAGADHLTYGLLGLCHAKSGNPISAEHAFHEAMMLSPDTIDWQIGLADSYFQQERYADAAAFFGTLIERDPSRPELWIERGRAFAMLDQADKAAQMFEWADSLGGSTPASLMGLGDIYANKGLYELCADAYARALDLDQSKVEVKRVLQVADFICRRGAHDETARLVDEIATRWDGELDLEQQTRLLKLRRRVAVGRGADEEAVAALEEIVNLNPLDGEALLLLGMHFATHEEPEKAALYYERAANIEDTEADAKLRHGELLARQGKYREAIPFLRDSYELEPRDFVQRFLQDVERVADRK